MNPRTIHLPTFPSQIVEEVSPHLELVYVIPVRNPNDADDIEQFLLQLPTGRHHIEAILVIHSFSFDGDEVKNANLDFYWKMEQRKPQLKEQGLVLHLVNYIGLDQLYEHTLLPFFIGMDEALQRLSDAGNMNGVIALMEGAEQPSTEFTAALLKYYQLSPQLAAAECECLFELDEAHQDSDTFNALVNRELQQRLHQFLLLQSEYPVTQTGQPYLFSIKAWMYRQIERKSLPTSLHFQQLFHQVTALGGQTATVRSAIKSPDPGQPPHSDRLEKWKRELHTEATHKAYDLKCYEQLGALLTALPPLYEAACFDNYQQVIRDLPQPVVAFLSETSFFENWQHMQAAATNYEQFKRAFFNWLDPVRLLEMLDFTATHFQQLSDLQTVAAKGLRKHLGIRTAVMDNEQLLYCLRKKANGLTVVRSTGRA